MKGNGGYKHSNSHSTTSLSSAFTDTAPSSNSITGLQSLPGPPVSESLAHDDAQRALDTLWKYVQQEPNDLLDENDYTAILKLIEKLRFEMRNDSIPGLYQFAE